MLQKHEPTHVIGFLEGGRMLATNEAQDLYFVVETDGAFRRIDAAEAAVLFQRHVPRQEENRLRQEMLAKNLQRRLIAMCDTRKERAKQMREERARTLREKVITVPTRHIRIADKKRELEEKIRTLEARLAEAQAAGATEAENPPQEEGES